MANWKDIAGASKSINKTDSIDMKPENRDCMESVMVALAAAGRVQEMALVAQTLEKIETKANLSAVVQDLGLAIHELRESQRQPEPVPDPRVDEMQNTMKDLVKAIESK